MTNDINSYPNLVIDIKSICKLLPFFSLPEIFGLLFFDVCGSYKNTNFLVFLFKL